MACDIDDKSVSSCQQTCCMLIAKTCYPQACLQVFFNKLTLTELLWASDIYKSVGNFQQICRLFGCVAERCGCLLCSKADKEVIYLKFYPAQVIEYVAHLHAIFFNRSVHLSKRLLHPYLCILIFLFNVRISPNDVRIINTQL